MVVNLQCRCGSIMEHGYDINNDLLLAFCPNKECPEFEKKYVSPHTTLQSLADYERSRSKVNANQQRFAASN